MQFPQLLDGFQPSDIVPVEMSFQVTTGGKDGKPGDPLATMQYGQAVDKDHKAPADPEDGQVLAKRPAGIPYAAEQARSSNHSTQPITSLRRTRP